MPLAFDEEPADEAGPQIRVGGSIAAELDWVMHAAWNPEHRDENETLRRICGEGAELGQRVLAVWGGDTMLCCGLGMELCIVAHHGGLLFSLDAAHLLGHLEELCATAPTNLTLASESDADRAAIRRRIELLRTSDEVRSRYIALVRDLWAAVGPEWRRHGRPVVDAAVWERRERLRRTGSWQEVARHPTKPFKPALISLVSSLGPGETLDVVPAYFGCSYGYMDLTGALLISLAAAGTAADARARTEALARRLRTISDPTRLAILEVLRHEPSTVTELADSFSLAQPTVSNHVKVLRGAGLVEPEPHGGRRLLVVDEEAVRGLMIQLEGMLVGARGSQGDARGAEHLPVTRAATGAR
jgi:DNA-binding transcriptional ArsR family regulator